MTATSPTVEALAARTRERLGSRVRRVAPPSALIRAAVLLPIVDRGEPYLVFAKRSHLVGHHKGQIAFPGGILSAADASPLDAALRECEEEIGLPRRAVDVLGVLDDSETVATQFLITPFVGLVRTVVAWQPDGQEIEKVIEVPFAALTRHGSFRIEHWEREGVRRAVYFFDYEGETIWGATARILRDFLDVLGDGG